MSVLCECGCGELAPIAVKTSARFGHVQGQPCRYVRGHATRGKRLNRVAVTPTGKDSPAWRGGRTIHGPSGYVLVNVGLDHPMADCRGYVYEHRLVMAESLGRELLPDEEVHHLDGDKQNNTAENLEILSKADHARLHLALRAA